MFDLVAPNRLLLAFTVGFFSLATATNGAAGLKSRAVGKVPKRATDNDLRYQPALDFDTDSCYNVAAINCDGVVSEGLPASSPTAGCRDEADLDDNNVYSRQRCNSGWCAYMYDYYFEKDYAAGGSTGHQNDWEHIIVWVPDDSSIEKWVCGSAHGGWECREGSEVRWHDGDHPKMVYHKDKASTHAFRFANAGDDRIENHKGTWQLSDLVSWNGFPTTEIRDKLSSHNFGSASFALKDSSFSSNLRNAVTSDCSDIPSDNPVCNNDNFPYEFDPERDEKGSPGTPPETPDNQKCPGSNTPTPPPATTFKAMIVGDSITQGFEGDWTWRFRFWSWLSSEGVNVDLVGPWDGTHTNALPSDPKPPRLIGSGPAPPDAPRVNGLYTRGLEWPGGRHWALWGRQAAQVKGEIRGKVSEHGPDHLLIMLGFNDLGWFVSGPEGTLQSIKTIVDEARAANSNVKILLANVVHRTFIDGRDDLVANTDRYNAMLKDAIPGWSTSSSRVELVDVAGEYSCTPRSGCPAGYDGLHPSELGEFQIARAFSKTLVRMGVGKNALEVPASDSGGFSNGKSPVPPTGLRVSSAPWGLKIEWDALFGANSYEVRSRLKGQSDWQTWPSGISWPINRWDNSWVLDGQEWEYSVRTNMGLNRVSDWTGIASTVAHPTNPKGPNNLRVEPRGNGIFISWDPVPGATLYEVITADRTATGTVFPNGRGVQGTSVTITDSLDAGHIQAIAVVTWTSSGPGWPSVGNSVLPGAGTPGAVNGLSVSNTDPTTVVLSWPASAGAASYRVYFRNFKNNEDFRTDDYSTAAGTSHTVAFLFPGTWNFEFYVVAQNGDLKSGRSNIVVPPVYPGFETK